MSYPSPCDSCARCTNTSGCTAWKIRYLYRQKQINAYARRLAPARTEDVDLLRLYHPDKYHQWLQHGPCKLCAAASHCDTPCPAYLRWWDERMEYFRRMLYG